MQADTLVAPGASLYVPGAHSRQAEVELPPVSGLYVPGGPAHRTEQILRFHTYYVVVQPCRYKSASEVACQLAVSQLEAESGHGHGYLWHPHAVHCVAPLTSLKDPGSHGWQTESLVACQQAAVTTVQGFQAGQGVSS